jgi:hypothetical protein
LREASTSRPLDERNVTVRAAAETPACPKTSISTAAATTDAKAVARLVGLLRRAATARAASGQTRRLLMWSTLVH